MTIWLWTIQKSIKTWKTEASPVYNKSITKYHKNVRVWLQKLIKW